MRIELRITSGARAGQREQFEKSVTSIGRLPTNDLRFDPERDVDVSSKHAEIRVLDEQATIHDLGSTNGTFVNGERVHGARALRSGDTIAFGREGPQATFRMVDEVMASPAPAAAIAPVPPPAQPVRRDTTVRIAEAVERQTGKLRTMIGALGVLVVVGIAGAYWAGHRESAKAQAQIEALLRRNDSLSALFDEKVHTMRGKVAGFDSALATTKTTSERLRARMHTELAKGRNADVGDLAAQLTVAEGRQRALVSAARVDYEAIFAKNSAAIVFIACELANGDLVSGTGFNVIPSGLIVTNRHVVRDEQGRPAKRVAVLFDNTKGAWKHARVVKVSESDELAYLAIESDGPFPVVAGIAKTDPPPVGAPVAIIGYPLGTSTAGMGGDINAMRAKSTLGVGTMSKVLSDTLQFDAYAAQGSSGSPVFDARGWVVGVLFGAATESQGRIVYAVPSAKVVAQMP